MTLNKDRSKARFLGAAFLIQAVASAVSGLFLLQPLIVPHDMAATLRALALWRLVAATLALGGTVLTLLFHEGPIVAFPPNLPLELGAGLWSLTVGIRDGTA